MHDKRGVAVMPLGMMLLAAIRMLDEFALCEGALFSMILYRLACPTCPQPHRILAHACSPRHLHSSKRLSPCCLTHAPQAPYVCAYSCMPHALV
jgi:hypothetical protein